MNIKILERGEAFNFCTFFFQTFSQNINNHKTRVAGRNTDSHNSIRRTFWMRLGKKRWQPVFVCLMKNAPVAVNIIFVFLWYTLAGDCMCLLFIRNYINLKKIIISIFCNILKKVRNYSRIIFSLAPVNYVGILCKFACKRLSLVCCFFNCGKYICRNFCCSMKCISCNYIAADSRENKRQ